MLWKGFQRPKRLFMAAPMPALREPEAEPRTSGKRLPIALIP